MERKRIVRVNQPIQSFERLLHRILFQMKKYFLIFLLLLSSTVEAQNIVQERLLSSSLYYNGTFYDSSHIFYPNQHQGYLGDTRSLYDWNLYWSATYDSITKYSSPTQAIHTRYFERDRTSSQVSVHLLMRSDSIPFYNYASKEKVWVDKKTTNVIRYDLYGYATNASLKEIILNSIFTEYNSNDQRVKDSIIYFINGEASNYRLISNTYFDNKELKQSITFEAYSLAVDIGSYVIRNYNELGSLIKQESFIRNSNQITTNLEVIEYQYDEKNRIILEVETAHENGLWDTVRFSAHQYEDSTFSQNNIEVTTTYTKNNVAEEFIPLNRIVNQSYSNNLLQKRTFYSWDSVQWVQEITFEYQYDSSNRITKLFHSSPRSRTTVPTPTATKRNWTYTKHGNLKSHIVSEAYDIENKFYKTREEYYYYEPYLNEETSLNYSQLVPIVYPNPFQGDVQILFSCVPNKEGSITIFNSGGKIISTHDFSSPNEFYQYEWDATNQPSGIYYARIIMGKEISTVRLIKQ